MHSDKIGKYFGELKITGIKKNCLKDRIFWCECSCGTIISRRNSSLLRAVKQKRKPSCGCVDGSSPMVKRVNQGYRKAKREAKKIGKSVSLNKLEFQEIVIKPCYYCGVEPPKNCIHSLDFMETNEETYHIGNSVSCCSICENAKKELSATEFESWINRVYKTMQRNKLGLPTGEIIQVAI